VRPGQRILIKPNLIVPMGPEVPAQTHPEVIAAVAQCVIDAGAIPQVGDSPAWGNVRGCLAAMGVDQRLEAMGVDIVQLGHPVRMKIEGSWVGISRTALEADAIINLPKLKAHQQLGATFAVKNMYGCVAGKEKAFWHFSKGHSPELFCRLLIGIYKQLVPVVNIIDGIIAMEGQGPISGTPKPIGALVAGEDAMACESVCARLVGLDPGTLPILQTAKRMGFGCCDEGLIEKVGDDLQGLVCSDFRPAVQAPLRFSLLRICKSITKQGLILCRNYFRK
jgi:uncharacterized protein (DUF362 family)